MPSPAVRLDERFRLDGVRVLVVDDTPYVRDVVRDILTEDGVKVTAVASAEEAAQRSIVATALSVRAATAKPV